ncbi:ATP-binding cassette domain-containing protein [Parasediminibacterium sp. JCM 36343]|uniref:ABC transporter ATP-binding protein n=1 Tax=Parasediminibacterium sp. JCM 36343 TaxID=3374279 RepID=UPI00397C9744
MSLLQVLDIFAKTERGNGLSGINFTQNKYQKIAVAGETGSGKSTLLKIVAGLAQPSAGQVLFDGKKVKGPFDQLIPGHKGIAYLSQQFELPNFLTVEQVLIYANPLWDVDAEKDEVAKALYETCKITHLLTRKTDQLSGGEKQRVALTRLLLTAPKLLLLDEPFSNLDMVHKNILKEVLNEVSEKLSLSCIMVSHDPLDTLSWADTILVMKDGQIIQQGTPAYIYRHPANEYIAGLFGKYNSITAAIAAAVFNIQALRGKEDMLYIRPECFRLSLNPTSNSLKGIANKLFFFGSYYEMEIMLIGNNTITVKTNTSQGIKKGDAVYVSLLADVFAIN